MALDPKQIQELIAASSKSKTTIPKADPTVRTMETWFVLNHVLGSKCTNENCKDPRRGGIATAIVGGLEMCRYCFLDGWGLPDEGQLELGGETDGE